MQVYNQLWIRQSEALAEAVQRGLQGPLEPGYPDALQRYESFEPSEGLVSLSHN